MPENAKNEEAAAATEAQQDVAQASDAKAEATSTASDELSEDELKAVAGGQTQPWGLINSPGGYELEVFPPTPVDTVLPNPVRLIGGII